MKTLRFSAIVLGMFTTGAAIFSRTLKCRRAGATFCAVMRASIRVAFISAGKGGRGGLLRCRAGRRSRSVAALARTGAPR